MFDNFTATACATDHYLVVAKVRARLRVNKQRSHRFHMKRLNLKNLNEVEGKEQHRVEVSNRSAASGYLEAEDINEAWETTGEYKNFSQRESMLL
jgi:hypothetical protein